MQNIKFGRTKATGLIHVFIGKAGKEELFKSLRKGKCVLIVDESTDKTTAKFCVIVNELKFLFLFQMMFVTLSPAVRKEKVNLKLKKKISKEEKHKNLHPSKTPLLVLEKVA